MSAAKPYRSGFNITKRIHLAMDFLNTFEIPESEEGEGEGEGGKGEGENEEGEKGTGKEGKSEGESGEGKSSPDEGEGETSPSGPSGPNPDASEAVSKILEEIKVDADKAGEISKEVEEASTEVTKDESRTESVEIDGYTLKWNKLVERDILDRGLYLGGSANPECKIDFKFLKNLQAIRTANRTPGAARKSGSVMVKSRLTRIATDGKIFAKNDAERKTLKRIEVIINVDFSGSTIGSVINNELGSAMAMSKILRQARIAHSVYGHTSLPDGVTPILYHIFSYDMKTTNHDFDKRFELARRIKLIQYFDGVVIKRLGEKFTGRQASRFLINLSDGEPAAPGYMGYEADKHTKGEIETLRRRGIAVFAISVVGHVVSANDGIYGKDFNIDGSRNTSAQFQRLIQKIAIG